MLRTRLWVGSLLALGAAAVLLGDRWLAPWFPCLLACVLGLAVLAGRELVSLFPAAYRPSPRLPVVGTMVILAANWYAVVQQNAAPWLPPVASPWEPVLFAFVAVVATAFLAEMYSYREPGAVVPRLALTVFAVAYLGLFPSFLAQQRWLDPSDPYKTSLFLALTIFVPKGGDVGAFFAGTFLGRTKMTPVLSPKKTWEGAAGGLLLSVAVAVGVHLLWPVFRGGVLSAAAFGAVVCVAGVLGDLAESLLKRDGQSKDASKSIPGFGGLLDVIDSVLYAAPVAYLWFRIEATTGVGVTPF